FTDSEKFLKEHVNLIHEGTCNYITGWTILLQTDDDYIGMHRLTVQLMIINCIRILMEELKYDSIKSITEFFQQVTDNQEYKDTFENDVYKFRLNIEKRAQKENEEIQAIKSLTKDKDDDEEEQTKTNKEKFSENM
ncbi:unnamed protein product, partial [Rotaria sp. Silwood2]